MIDFINNIVAHMPSGAVLSGVGMVVEAILRMIPSQKPLSILYFAEDVLHAIADLASATGTALEHILPQRLKTTPALTAPAAPAQA